LRSGNFGLGGKGSTGVCFENLLKRSSELADSLDKECESLCDRELKFSLRERSEWLISISREQKSTATHLDILDRLSLKTESE